MLGRLHDKEVHVSTPKIETAPPRTAPSLTAACTNEAVEQSGSGVAAGHSGTSQEGLYFYKPRAPNDRGENEHRMLTLVQQCRLRGESIADYVPELHGMEERDGKPNFKLSNMLAGFTNPRLMDCKIGVRCFTEDESASSKLRVDLFERWSKMDPSVLTDEERQQGAITKRRWMELRDSRSATQTARSPICARRRPAIVRGAARACQHAFWGGAATGAQMGFRIDAISTPHGKKTAFDSELFRVREDDEVLATIRWFLPRVAECEGCCHPREIARDVLARLHSFEAALLRWEPFAKNEFVGSSLFFMADAMGRSDVKMIDFGVTRPWGMGLRHDQPWVLGNHEDGYLTGVHSLQRLWTQLLVEDDWL